MGGGSGTQAKKVKGLRSKNCFFQSTHGDVKYSTGNTLAKECILMTHRHRQWCGDCLREWGV